MKRSLFDLLRCPFCGGHLSPTTAGPLADELEYGVLSCYCGHYPVVAGIPVLMKGAVRPRGTTVGKLIDLIEAGQHRAALMAMLMPSAPAADTLLPRRIRRVMQALPAVRGMSRVKRFVGQPAAVAWRKRATSFLSHLDEHVTACDLFDFHFCYMTGDAREPYTYYSCRFGMPRHLVALSFATLIHRPDKPVLDLGCGFGHITRYLLHRAEPQPVIGLDLNFFALYVAKGWMAPQAQYVCCSGDTSIPFPDSTFSAVFCSDVFWVMHAKPTCIRELKRLTQEDGLILLVGLRNKLVKEGIRDNPWPLPPEGYEALVADMPHRLITHRDVLAQYLRKHGPPLARSPEIGRSTDAQWLSVVASHQPELLRDYGPFEDWPHAAGRLAVNPLYREERRDGSGNVHFRLTMPSPKYEQENGDCRQYEPETVSIPATVLTALARGQRTAEVEPLIEQCVVVGLPERFLRHRLN
jgi:SAM-dependent methyltransferase/uncharacterized protein YbaR (Trm112 family)